MGWVNLLMGKELREVFLKGQANNSGDLTFRRVLQTAGCGEWAGVANRWVKLDLNPALKRRARLQGGDTSVSGDEKLAAWDRLRFEQSGAERWLCE